MKILNFWIQEPYKTFLIEWKKKIEWRLNKWKFKEIHIWDVLILNTWEKFEIIWKWIYKDFKEMLKIEGFKNIIPDKDSIEEAENIYYKFYTKEQEQEFWVVAIEIRMVTMNKKN